MSVTKELFELAQGMITKSPEVLDNEDRRYEMVDTGAVEVEVGEFLYGLTRLIKPIQVLTTGVFTGVSDMYIAKGLLDNGYGYTTALEIEQTHLDRARELWKKTQVIDHIQSQRIPSLDFQPKDDDFYQLMFLDSEPHLRFAELVKFYDHLTPGGFVLIHDLHNHLSQQPNEEHGFGSPFGRLPIELDHWIMDGSLKPWYFPNPRGMVGFQKRKGGEKPDYV